MKDVTCEEWGWVAGRVVSFCNLDVTEVAEFGSGTSVRTLDVVAGAEEGININMVTNDKSKAPIKKLYINHHIVNSMNDSELIT